MVQRGQISWSKQDRVLQRRISIERGLFKKIKKRERERERTVDVSVGHF